MAGDCYPAEAFTEEDVTAFIISSQTFYRCLEKSPFFREFVFKKFSESLSNVIKKMSEVVFSGIDSRLARELLIKDVNVLKITHQELASQLGSAREVVSRPLKQFEAKGRVRLGRGIVTIINAEALKRLA